MPPVNYDQFCALSRAAEVLGERWTLLIVRDLLLGPLRFTDLRHRLDGVTSSVLTERLTRLAESGVVTRRRLPPPAATTVYELTAMGHELKPAILALIRWGAWFLFPQRDGERFEPEWLVLLLTAYARSDPSPDVVFELSIGGEEGSTRIFVSGSVSGTWVETSTTSEPNVRLRAPGPRVLVGLINGSASLEDAMASGALTVEGDLTLAQQFQSLFIPPNGFATGTTAPSP